MDYWLRKTLIDGSAKRIMLLIPKKIPKSQFSNASKHLHWNLEERKRFGSNVWLRCIKFDFGMCTFGYTAFSIDKGCLCLVHLWGIGTEKYYKKDWAEICLTFHQQQALQQLSLRKMKPSGFPWGQLPHILEPSPSKQQKPNQLRTKTFHSRSHRRKIYIYWWPGT